MSVWRMPCAGSNPAALAKFPSRRLAGEPSCMGGLHPAGRPEMSANNLNRRFSNDAITSTRHGSRAGCGYGNTPEARPVRWPSLWRSGFDSRPVHNALACGILSRRAGKLTKQTNNSAARAVSKTMAEM